jgi:hypothetical protein
MSLPAMALVLMLVLVVGVGICEPEKTKFIYEELEFNF